MFPDGANFCIHGLFICTSFRCPACRRSPGGRPSYGNIKNTFSCFSSSLECWLLDLGTGCLEWFLNVVDLTRLVSQSITLGIYRENVFLFCGGVLMSKFGLSWPIQYEHHAPDPQFWGFHIQFGRCTCWWRVLGVRLIILKWFMCCSFSKLPSWTLSALHVWCLGLIHHLNISCATQASRFCGGPSINQYWKNRFAKNIVPFSSYVSLGSFPKKGSLEWLYQPPGPTLDLAFVQWCDQVVVSIILAISQPSPAAKMQFSGQIDGKKLQGWISICPSFGESGGFELQQPQKR